MLLSLLLVAEPNVVDQWTALYDAHTEIACLIHRQFELYYPFNMIQELRSMFEKQAGVEKQREKDKKDYIPKPKNPKPTAMERPAKDDASHHCKEVGHWKRNCPVYLCMCCRRKGSKLALPVLKGFRIEWKLKQGVLYLYMGNEVRAQVEVIGSFDLVFTLAL
ncbi:hypothetical protein Tco_1338813 [Tanacetum coccineum]